MKKVFLSVFTIISIALNAQQSGWCGTQISKEWMDAFYQRDKSHLTHKSLNPVTLPISYHIVGMDNGTGYYGLNELFRSHCELQSLYDNANITFYIYEIDYIDNTDFYNGVNTYGLFQQSNNPNTINVYIVDNMDGVCGYSFVPQPYDNQGWPGPNRGGVMLQKGCMQVNNTTYRHDMGHYLNLPHTFYGWEGEPTPDNSQNAPSTINGSAVERANGTNCNNSGDGFCDTPPDYISDRWSCSFARTFIDPVGNSFNVDDNNFMSYSNDGCAQYLSDDQYAEVNAAAANHRPYLLTLPVPDEIIMNTINSTFPPDSSNNLNSSNIVFKWEADENAQFYQIQITQNNFINPLIDEVTTDTFYVFQNANINTNYQYRVKPVNLLNTCTNYSNIKGIKTSPRKATIVTTNLDCPESTNGEATISITGNYTSATYKWYEGLNSTNEIPFEYTNSISGLSAGDYSVIAIINNIDTLFTSFTIAASNPINVSIIENNGALIASISGGVPPYSFTWQNGATTLTINDPVVGENYLVVLDQNGCQKIATYNYQISSVNDINNTLNNVYLTPNPLNGNALNIFYNANKSETIAIRLSDINGKILNTKEVVSKEGKNKVTFNNLNLAGGVYFVNLSINGSSITKKLMVLN
ncbi:MAG: T9SS type A sorting domain-containing protein [Chitinophagales bacterium]